MDLEWKVSTFDFEPTAAQMIVTDPVAYAIMGVKRGTLVAAVAVRIGVVFDGTGMSLVVGDDVAGGGDIDGFVAAADVTEGTLGLYDGYGAYFSGANGRLYTADDTIDITYTGAVDVTTGQAQIIVVYAEIE